jgi:hypothetical protein
VTVPVEFFTAIPEIGHSRGIPQVTKFSQAAFGVGLPGEDSDLNIIIDFYQRLKFTIITGILIINQGRLNLDIPG